VQGGQFTGKKKHSRKTEHSSLYSFWWRYGEQTISTTIMTNFISRARQCIGAFVVEPDTTADGGAGTSAFVDGVVHCACPQSGPINLEMSRITATSRSWYKNEVNTVDVDAESIDENAPLADAF
jgi:hypothetical protein